MRDCARNKIEVWYALRDVGKEKDEWGNTKDVTTCGDPKKLTIGVSANKGEASAQAFGADLRYDREMVTHDMSCPIDEYSKLWIGADAVFYNEKFGAEGDAIIIKEKELTVTAVGDALKIETKEFPAKGVDDALVISAFKTHNYEVAAVSESLNCIRYAIRRVNVSR